MSEGPLHQFRELIRERVIGFCFTVTMALMPKTANGRAMIIWGYRCYFDEVAGTLDRFAPKEAAHD